MKRVLHSVPMTSWSPWSSTWGWMDGWMDEMTERLWVRKKCRIGTCVTLVCYQPPDQKERRKASTGREEQPRVHLL